MAVIRRTGTAIRMAFWLGWQIESNWTDPLLFVGYSFLRPMAGVLILFFMFIVLSGGQPGPMLYFFLVGSVLWPYVVQTLQGLAFTVVDDREDYHMIRYVYTLPVPYWVYLIGRTIAKLAVASVSVVITFAAVVLLLKLPIAPGLIDAPYLATSFLVGFAGMWALGMAVASMSLNLNQAAWSLPEAIGGSLYLLCGAIFPITELPRPLQLIGEVLPVTYWLEAARRGLFGGGISSFPLLGDQAVFARLLLTTAVWAVLGFIIYMLGERRAKTTGNLDRTSAY